MNVLFTVFFTVVCPNETFNAYKANLTESEAIAEVRYFAENPKDNETETDSGESCIIVNAFIGV